MSGPPSSFGFCVRASAFPSHLPSTFERRRRLCAESSPAFAWIEAGHVPGGGGRNHQRPRHWPICHNGKTSLQRPRYRPLVRVNPVDFSCNFPLRATVRFVVPAALSSDSFRRSKNEPRSRQTAQPAGPRLAGVASRACTAGALPAFAAYISAVRRAWSGRPASARAASSSAAAAAWPLPAAYISCRAPPGLAGAQAVKNKIKIKIKK